MAKNKKPVPYPENTYLAVEVFKSGMTVKAIAEKIGVSRFILSRTINGHYKGNNIVPKLKKELSNNN
ncbi:hypothetical protein MM236_19005 [Belliella sp. DSM 107340]|uniref:Helix-turn-helix domain-containing protein n=1 Tax=Belliella calami TaxID=2923436 RepID=A0ABS9UTY6_9BACT|nr:hypothetical protein [Belliella calami]MCH7400092.1 hypothetical protein [Belliella calami]